MNSFDTGSTGFMLIATALVMLMTPGLAFFYGGLASKKNVVGIMFQSFVSLGITTIMWYVLGYSLCFSGGEGGVIGNLDKMFLHGVGPMTPCPGTRRYLEEHQATDYIGFRCAMTRVGSPIGMGGKNEGGKY